MNDHAEELVYEEAVQEVLEEAEEPEEVTFALTDITEETLEAWKTRLSYGVSEADAMKSLCCMLQHLHMFCDKFREPTIVSLAYETLFHLGSTDVGDFLALVPGNRRAPVAQNLIRVALERMLRWTNLNMHTATVLFDARCLHAELDVDELADLYVQFFFHWSIAAQNYICTTAPRCVHCTRNSTNPSHSNRWKSSSCVRARLRARIGWCIPTMPCHTSTCCCTRVQMLHGGE
jgi:hypothetical protein